MQRYRSHAESRYKVKRVSKGNPAVPAPAGNTTMQLHDVYKAVTGTPMTNHHDAGSDVSAAIAIAKEPTVWRRRCLGLQQLNGLYLLSSRREHVKSNLDSSVLSIRPPLPDFWLDEPDSEPAAKRRNLGPESGPTARASAHKARLAEFWDLHLDPEFSASVAKWTVFYGAGQTVKLLSGGRGRRQVFVPCGDMDPNARCRYRTRKEGETLAACKAAFMQITADHVDLVLAIITRAGALNKMSLYEAWVTFDEGALRDSRIADSCTRDNFAAMWSVLCFVDYSTLVYNDRGYVVTQDPIVRVRSFLRRAENNWDLNWTFGQYLCLDEYGSPGAQSAFCPIKMFNKDKPLKHHIDIIMMCDGNWNYPRFAHVFLKTGEPMARIVMDHCWDAAAWDMKNKVVFTDSRYCNMGMIKDLHVRGAGFVSTMSPEAACRGRKPTPGSVTGAGQQQDSVHVAESAAARRQRLKEVKRVMPFDPVSKTIQDQLDGGWMRRARLEVPVDGTTQALVIEAYLWQDSKLVGFVVADDFLGTAEGTTERQRGSKKVQLPTFLAQRLHAKLYGGVDRIGRGAKLYGIHFTIVPWHKHLVITTVNLHMHAIWTLALYDMAVRPDYHLLDPFRASTSDSGETSTSRGITARRKFCLALTADVIQRAIERIEAKGSWDPRPKRQQPSLGSSTTPAGGERVRGRPRKHNKREVLHSTSRRCHMCYLRVSLENKKLAGKDRYTRDQLMLGVLGTVHYSMTGCAVCNKTLCRLCVETYQCPV